MIQERPYTVDELTATEWIPETVSVWTQHRPPPAPQRKEESPMPSTTTIPTPFDRAAYDIALVDFGLTPRAILARLGHGRALLARVGLGQVYDAARDAARATRIAACLAANAAEIAAVDDAYAVYAAAYREALAAAAEQAE